MKYLIRKKKPAVAHYFFGFDTACRMYSTGGLKKSKYRIIESLSDGLRICIMCNNNYPGHLTEGRKP